MNTKDTEKTKELSRVYDTSFDNSNFIEPMIKAVKANPLKYFLAFRTSPARLTIYSKGREMVAFIPCSKETWKVRPRKISSSMKPEKVKINKNYEDVMKKNGYSLNEQFMRKEKSYDKLIEITSQFLDDYYNEKEEEKTIQNDIATRYQSWNHNLLCVDQEYNQSFESTKAKMDSNIKGRYDLIMVQKIDDAHYIPVFVELKSNKTACIDCNSGIINHISDMQTFLDKYEKDESQARTVIQRGIEFAVERKAHFGLIPEDISQKIDFSKPQFWILFDMTSKYQSIKPTTKKDLDSLVDSEVERARHVAETYKDGHNVDIYEKMDAQPLELNGMKVKKYELCKHPNIVESIKKYVFEHSYYNHDGKDFIKINK